MNSYLNKIAFDPIFYRNAHLDLQGLRENELINHYINHGQHEGRMPSSYSQSSFISSIPKNSSCLEIGPFTTPKLIGKNVKYLDVLTTNELIDRAKKLGMNTNNIPNISFVGSDIQSLGINEKFDLVFSSHLIEHQPDLIKHLNDVYSILKEKGSYYLIVPDMRYCFDHFMDQTRTHEIICAHFEKRTRHTIKSLIEHRLMLTHNDSKKHWMGDSGGKSNYCANDLEKVRQEFYESEKYIDVHSWYFTPESLYRILEKLFELKLINLKIKRIFPTIKYSNEFFCILEKF